MLESVTDLVSLIVMILFVLTGFIVLYSVSGMHRRIRKKARKSVYYDLYEDLNDDDEDDEKQNPLNIE